MMRRRDLGVALLLMLGWLGLVYWFNRDRCNNQCPADKYCQDLCWKRGHCPSAQEP